MSCEKSPLAGWEGETGLPVCWFGFLFATAAFSQLPAVVCKFWVFIVATFYIVLVAYGPALVDYPADKLAKYSHFVFLYSGIKSRVVVYNLLLPGFISKLH